MKNITNMITSIFVLLSLSLLNPQASWFWPTAHIFETFALDSFELGVPIVTIDILIFKCEREHFINMDAFYW